MAGGAHRRCMPSGARRAAALLSAAPLLPAALLSLLLAAPGCPRPAAPSAAADPHADLGPPDAFGVRAGPDHVLVPRAALVHTTAGLTPTTFQRLDDAMVLSLDTSGLLGALGLRRGDRLLACDGAPVPDIEAVDACLVRLYAAPGLELDVERNGAPHTVRVVLDGPSVPAPLDARVWQEPQTWPEVSRSPLPGPDDLAAAYGLVRDGATVRLPRAALVRLVDDRVEVRPLREGGEIVAYDVRSPILAALGWAGATARVDELALTSDDAVRAAIARLFTASRVVVTPAGGAPPLTLEIGGAPTAPPASWRPDVKIDGAEARLRAGVRLAGADAYVPRAALHPLLELARLDAPRRRAPPREDPPGPIHVDRALGDAIAELLDLPWGTTLERIDGVPAYGAASVTELRRRLLTAREVVLDLGGAAPRGLVVHVEGEPVALPDDWPSPRGAPALDALEPGPFADLVLRDGDTARLHRLAVPWLLRGEPLSGVPARGALQLDNSLFWSALRVPPWTVLTAVDGAPATDPTALLDLTARLCTAAEVTLTFRGRDGGTFTRVVHVEGPPVTPP